MKFIKKKFFFLYFCFSKNGYFLTEKVFFFYWKMTDQVGLFVFIIISIKNALQLQKHRTYVIKITKLVI